MIHNMKEMEQKNHEESKSMERPEESIRRFVKEFADIWNQHNAKTTASCFVNDGEFTKCNRRTC